MDSDESKVNILDAVEEKHEYLDESKLLVVKSEEEILIEIQELEDRISQKKYLVRLMNDNLKEVDNEINRWQSKKRLLDTASNQLRDYEKNLQDKIIRIRQERKKVAMDAIIKQKMSEELRDNLPTLIQNYGKLMQEPSEITKTKFSADVAENTAEVIAKIRKRFKESEEESAETKSAETKKPLKPKVEEK